ncbi:hypothetical protein [Aurantimonas sp. A3-2-R12]|uniref:hypothetical protein n=1 Tax=Aurantimonas sp. A3-2-R12 TaxID=3114362 RepID=UPI002E189DB5|nr:hypothetical protein [Aurantimonas sp. A3-2-R12]
MPYRHWCAAIAVGLSVGITALGQAQEKADRSNGQAEDSQHAADKASFSIPINVIQNKAEAEAAQRREKEAAEREKADLLAQQGMDASTRAMNEATQDMRDYALYSTLLVGVGTTLLFVTLSLTWQANRAAQSAVAVTREIGEAQTRSYLTCTSGRLRKSAVKGCMAIKVEARLQNGGQSPAFGIRISGQVSINGTAIHPPFNVFAHSSIVDAGKERTAESQDWIFRDIKGFGPSLPKGSRYGVMGTIHWRDVFGRGHETEFELRQTNGGWMNENMGVIDYDMEGASTVMRIDGRDMRRSADNEASQL